MNLRRHANQTAKALPPFIRDNLAMRIRIYHRIHHEGYKQKPIWKRCMEIRDFHNALIDGAFIAHTAHKHGAV
jgi:hypothetical protein